MLKSQTTPLGFFQKITSLLLRYGVLILFTAAILIPILLAALGGLKTTGELMISPISLPDTPHWENYWGILQGQTFWRGLTNSFIVMVGTAALMIISASAAAYVFARLSFRGRDLLFNYFTVGLLFPLTVAILPLYILLRQIGLLNNLFGVVLVQVAFGLTGNIVILRGFFRSIPRELEDAAYIDGCTPFGFFWRVLLPLSRPALAAVSVLVMVVSWNELFLPLLVLNDEKLWTLPLGMMQFQGQYQTEWSLVMAFVTLSLVPTIIFYLFAERHIIAGLTAGAIKG
jgi:raffinose/stachyose/melibiose transport system permease protein